MLFQHHHRLGIGCDSAYAAASDQLVALPTDIRPSQQHLVVLSPPSQRYLTQHSTKTSREYAGSCSHKRSTLQTARSGVRRTIMHRVTSASTSSSAPVRFQYEFRGMTDAFFSFQASPTPAMTLDFPPRPSDTRSNKRCRALTDVDGEHSCLYKKKRRLRLFLITSRLSPEFSHPATNIVDRGMSKIAVWAKQKALGRNLLRKAAILNRIRLQDLTAKEPPHGRGRLLIEQEKEQEQLELAKLAFVYGSHDIHTCPVFQRTSSFPPTIPIKAGKRERSKSPRAEPPFSELPPNGTESAETSNHQSPNDAYASSYTPPPTELSRKTNFPLPPSPLGLSNYDAFDLEDDIPDPYSHLDDNSYDDQSDGREEDRGYADAQAHSANNARSYASTIPAPTTTTPALAKTPPRIFYSDFSILNPGEPVVGDYDQIDEGLWPNALAPGPLPPTSAREELAMGPSSCSPNFTALFATSAGHVPR